MQKSKIFIAAGAVTLGVVSIFGTKPAKKFSLATAAYAAGTYNVTIYSGATGGALTNNRKPLNITYKTAFFKTVGGAAVTLVTSVGSANKVYLHK